MVACGNYFPTVAQSSVGSPGRSHVSSAFPKEAWDPVLNETTSILSILVHDMDPHSRSLRPALSGGGPCKMINLNGVAAGMQRYMCPINVTTVMRMQTGRVGHRLTFPSFGSGLAASTAASKPMSDLSFETQPTEALPAARLSICLEQARSENLTAWEAQQQAWLLDWKAWHVKLFDRVYVRSTLHSGSPRAWDAAFSEFKSLGQWAVIDEVDVPASRYVHSTNFARMVWCAHEHWKDRMIMFALALDEFVACKDGKALLQRVALQQQLTRPLQRGQRADAMCIPRVATALADGCFSVQWNDKCIGNPRTVDSVGIHGISAEGSVRFGIAPGGIRKQGYVPIRPRPLQGCTIYHHRYSQPNSRPNVTGASMCSDSTPVITRGKELVKRFG